MSLPRPIFKGDLYMVTRRTNGRRFYLKPTKKRTKKLEYIIAVAARRHGVLIHAVVAMSNHWHCVASDPKGLLPDFLRDVHSWIAKVFKVGIPKWEAFWSNEQTNRVKANSDNDIVELIGYTMANPVSSGLVAHGDTWPGLRTCWPAKRKPVPRPKFFRDKGPMPKSATLKLHRPPVSGLSPEMLDSVIKTAIARREEFWFDVFTIAGRRFVGRRAVLAQSIHNNPTSVQSPRRRGGRVPSQRHRRSRQRFRDFVNRYKRAFKLWRAGTLDVEFPAGTYKLRRTAPIICAPE